MSYPLRNTAAWQIVKAAAESRLKELRAELEGEGFSHSTEEDARRRGGIAELLRVIGLENKALHDGN